MVLDDRLIRAGRAIARGDPIEAIAATGVRDDPHALAIRGIALSQLHEYAKARALLTRAAAAFAREGDLLYRARALAAFAEIVAAERDVARAASMLSEAAEALRTEGDRTNAAWAELVAARLRLLDGDLDAARGGIERAEDDVRDGGTATVRAVVELARAEAAMRATQAELGRSALVEARRWAARAQNPLLIQEIARLEEALAAPVACEVREGRRAPIDLFRLEALLAPGVKGGPRSIVVDVLRRRVTVGSIAVADLRARPVLVALLASLARAWPGGRAARDLVVDGFAVRAMNESHRARLRVEIGRLRRLLGGSLTIAAERGGFCLRTKPGDEIVLVEPIEIDEAAALRALLADGEAWPVRSLATALGRSARTVQRSLALLCEAGTVRAIGNAKARRYTRVDAGERIASQMLLLGAIVGR